MAPPVNPPPSKVIPWTQVHDLVTDVYLQNVAFFFPEAVPGLQHRLHLANLTASIREYAIKHPNDVASVWTALQEHVRSMDVLVYTVSDMSLRLPSLGVTWDDLAEAIAIGLLSFVPKTDASVVIDEPFLESFGELGGLRSILQHNRWLVLLLVLRRAGCFNLRSSQNPREPAHDNAAAAD